MRFIGSRNEPKDATKTWPSEGLAKAIKKHGPRTEADKKIKMNLVDCKDVTKEVQEEMAPDVNLPLIVRFAPDVHVAGLGLLQERRNEEKWGGVLVRALESKDGLRRCFQYFYVYLKQNGVVSAFWNVFLPIALGLWGIYVLNFLVPFLGPENIVAVYPSLLLVVPVLPFLSAILPHYNEFLEGQQISFRSSTLLPVYFVLMVGIAYVPFMTFVLIALGTVFGIYWFLEWQGWAGTSHNMDYVPVFVYLKQRNRVWLFDHAIWDVWHYHTGSTRNPFNIFRHEAFEPFAGLSLTIDNPWHSMYRGTPALKGTRNYVLLGILCTVSILGILSSIVGMFPFSELTYILPLWCFLFVGTGLLIARRPYPLLNAEEQMTKLTSPESRLDDLDKLVALWNLFEIKAPTFLSKVRLRIVRSRMRTRKQKLIKKLDEFEKLKVLEGGQFGKLWNVYEQKGIQAVEHVTRERGLTLVEQGELDSENLRDELDLYDDYMDKLESYDRVRKDPRLVIVHKMQNPFNDNPNFMDSFRDTEEHLYSLIPFKDDAGSVSR